MPVLPGKSADDPDFDELSRRWSACASPPSDVGVLMLSHLLGWVSGDADGHRRIVRLRRHISAMRPRRATRWRSAWSAPSTADKFNTLFWNISATICDDAGGKFQQALADVLAENGVTRYQARQVIDSIFKDEEHRPGGGLRAAVARRLRTTARCAPTTTFPTVFKKLVKYTNNAWEYSTDNVLKTDRQLRRLRRDGRASTRTMPQFTDGCCRMRARFTYSVKHDENEQPIDHQPRRTCSS